MKMMLGNLNAIVANTLTDSIQMIDIDELHNSAENFFVVERIEEFAETILGQGGVKDNLIVRPLESGGYEIISGHRRTAAVRYLIEKGENISRLLPCLVQSYADEESMMLDLILMNVTTRRLSDAELWKSYETLDRIFQEKKEKGEKFGRLRETLAELLGVSSSQIGKLQNVSRNAIPEIKEAVERGELSISTANEIARLPEQEQETIASEPLQEVKPKKIKKTPTPIDFAEDAEPKDVPEEQPELEETEPEPKKVDTNVNFSSDETPDAESEQPKEEYPEEEPEEAEDAEPEKVDTNVNFQESSKQTQCIFMQCVALTQEEKCEYMGSGVFNTFVEGYMIRTMQTMGMSADVISQARKVLHATTDAVSAAEAWEEAVKY